MSTYLTRFSVFSIASSRYLSFTLCKFEVSLVNLCYVMMKVFQSITKTSQPAFDKNNRLIPFLNVHIEVIRQVTAL